MRAGLVGFVSALSLVSSGCVTLMYDETYTPCPYNRPYSPKRVIIIPYQEQRHEYHRRMPVQYHPMPYIRPQMHPFGDNLNFNNHRFHNHDNNFNQNNFHHRR